MEYRNENEIVVYSMGRSGSHAIVNWIASMCEEPIFFFNHCSLENPFYASSRYWRRIKTRSIKKFFVRFPIGKKRAFEKYRKVYKQYLMYSYEYRDIRNLKNGKFVEDLGLIIGESKNKYNILILRDFFNWLASVLIQRRSSESLDCFPQYNISGKDNWMQHASTISAGNYRRMKDYKTTELWKIYAEEFLGRTDHLKDNKICISFNQWFVDENYRKKIAELLNLKYSDFSLDFAGSPSSFDGTKYFDKDAQKMKALERWKILKDNIVYHEFLDAKSIELSYEIFGEEIGYGLRYNRS